MRVALGAAGALLLAAYPILVYVGLTRWSTRGVGLMMLLVLLPPHVIRALRKDRREHLKALLPLPVGIAAVLILAVAVDDPRLVLALPVLINVVLLSTFAGTLFGGRASMIERFARMQVDDLSEAEVIYCRRVTMVWCGIFVVNGITIAVLAITGPISLWTAWTGGVAYGLVGVVFAVELIIRKARFRRYGDGLADRVFARLWPPSSESS